MLLQKKTYMTNMRISMHIYSAVTASNLNWSSGTSAENLFLGNYIFLFKLSSIHHGIRIDRIREYNPLIDILIGLPLT